MNQPVDENSRATLFHREVDPIVASTVKNPYIREGIERSRTLLDSA